MGRETKPTWEDIDRRVETLYGLDEAARQDGLALLWIDIVSLLSAGQMEVLGEFWLEDFAKFDPQKGSFSRFLLRRLKLRDTDTRRKDQALRRVTDEDGKRQWRSSTVPMETPAEDKPSDSSTADTIKARQVADSFAEVYLDETACQLIAAMLGMSDNLTGQANNPRRHNYFRLFFTDGISQALRENEAIPDTFLDHERDLFCALKETFLDFFLTQRCRAVSALAVSETRPYGEVVEGKSMTPLAQPLPNDVYMTYLLQVEGEKIGAPALSQQKKAYRDYLHKALC